MHLSLRLSRLLFFNVVHCTILATSRCNIVVCSVRTLKIILFGLLRWALATIRVACRLLSISIWSRLVDSYPTPPYQYPQSPYTPIHTHIAHIHITTLQIPLFLLPNNHLIITLISILTILLDFLPLVHSLGIHVSNFRKKKLILKSMLFNLNFWA